VRRDTKALFKLLAVSFLIGGVVTGIVVAIALGVVDRPVGGVLAMTVLIGGSVALSRRLARDLYEPAGKTGKAGEADPPPARPWDKKS
jgi:hypothetical protein